MVAKQFLVDSDRFNRRTRTTIQHKLRVVMNCYTISEFVMNEHNNTFSFKKNYKIHGKRLEDPKQFTGYFTVENVDNEKSKIIIVVNT